MKKLALIAVLFFAACANDGPPRTYQANDAVLAVGNAARMGCSCVFVMGMSDEYCHAWVKATPDVASFSVDHGNKSVSSSAFISFSARAHYVDDTVGCVLE
jgi:hypothetical protein